MHNFWIAKAFLHPHHLRRVPVTVGFAAGNGCQAFEVGDLSLSLYTQALVELIDAQGHEQDIVPLLECVRDKVDRAVSPAATGKSQLPCAYSAKGRQNVRLVSLVGTVSLSPSESMPVNGILAQLRAAFNAQVWSAC